LAFTSIRAIYNQQVKSQRLSMRILVVLLLCSVSLNILLARNIDSRKEAIEHLKAEMRSTRELKLGESVPPIQAKDIDGYPVTVTYTGAGPAVVIYIFTPDCIWCTRNLPNVRMLALRSGGKYHFIGVSLSKDRLRDYISENKLDFPVYSEPAVEVISAYKLGGTPRTLVVSSEGRVLKNWFGAYNGDIKREVEDYFKISLPGVVETDTKEKKETKKDCESCGEE
jgi:peroxiredoxin